MAFPPGFLDELRGRVSLSGLVGRQVKLTRRGRELVGLCPFHHEKTPSFYVVEDKDFFHCFGCGAHGDAIGYVMRADNLDFLEAVEKLAGEAGLAVPQPTPAERERAQRQKTLLETLEAAACFYEARLWAPAGNRARDYLRQRGLDPETMRRFRLGWAPGPADSTDRRALRRALAGDFPEPLLVEAGLLHRPEAGEPYDYFRDRVMFPIGDRAGRVIAFGGRVLADGQPKYLNSPDSPVFEKGRVLYGWSAARAAGPDCRDAIVTEGYMDVIALYRAGLRSAVAPLGTALTEFQLQELWRLGPEPILCFDGDIAGRRAAARALRRALPLLRPGHSLRFAALPAGEDPDSLIRTVGRAGFDQVLTAARPLSRMLWELEVGAGPTDTPERRADLERRLSEDVGLIADRTVQAEYRRFVRQRLYESGRAAPPARHLQIRPRPAFVSDGPAPPPRSPGRAQREMREILFRLLLRSPALIDEVAEEFAALDIPEPALDKLRHEILEVEALRPGLDASALRQHLLLNGFAATVDALLSPSVGSGFLVRRSDSRMARDEWAHVIGMLMGGHRSVVTEASSNLLIEDVSAASWERFLAARDQILRDGWIDDDAM
ncbi:MAG TPA: DNA primase [Stellaceae bacterium]|jgi:DNA primase